MKKLISVFLIVCMCLSAFTLLVACGEPENPSGDQNASDENGSGGHEHVWDAGEITTAATKEADGVKTFTCTSCGETKTEAVKYTPRTTVTEDEWKTAMDFSAESYECTATMTSSGYSANMYIKVLADKIMQIERAADRMAVDYMEKAEGGYYYYNDETEALDENAERVYTRRFVSLEDTHGEDEFESNKKGPYFMIVGFVPYFADFTYDEANGCYTAATVGDGSTDVTVVMEDGKLVKLSFTNSHAKYDIDLAYDNITITLPTDFTEASNNNNSMGGDSIDSGTGTGDADQN